jgi:hypothetical protein
MSSSTAPSSSSRTRPPGRALIGELRPVYLGNDADGRPETKKPRAKSGTEITPEIADALPDEAERGYDLSKTRRRRVGRLSLGGRGTPPRVSFRATPFVTSQLVRT